MPRKRSRDEVMGTLARASIYLRPYRLQLGGVFALIIVVSLISLVFPALTGWIVDLANGRHPHNRFVSFLVPGDAKVSVGALVPFFLLYAFLLIARGVVLMTRNHLMQATGMKVTCDLRIAVFAHLQKLSIRFYEERQTGRVVARVTEDAAAMHQLVTGASVNLIGELTMAVGVLFLLLSYNWKMAAMALIIVPLFIFNYFWHRRRMRMESRRHRRHWSKVVGFLNERIANNRVVRAFAAEDVEQDAFVAGIRADFANYNRLIWRNTLLSSTADFLSGSGTLLALVVGAVLILKSQNNLGAPQFTTGELMAFLAYLSQLYGPIVRVFDANALIQAGVTSMEKIFAILDTQPHIPDNDALPAFPRIDGKVEFRDVSFAYRIGHTTLDHVSFKVEPGEMVALVGPSGAGKSTVITLLARFYDPTSGQVLIDDKPIAGFNVHSVRRQIGIVMQDNILFSGTIEENIRYGRPGASKEEVVAAAKAANCHDFVLKLKNGYDSRVGERGVSLSGGQRQRLAIARVLLRDPRILILDEATSALDTHSERLIQEATEKLMENRTALVIAHRLSTVVNADRILVMDQGRIVDSGKHEELLARPGLYSELYHLQFAENAS